MCTRFPLAQTVFCGRNISQRAARRLETDPVGKIDSSCSSANMYVAAVPHPTSGIGHAFANWNAGFITANRLGFQFANIPLLHGWDEFLGFSNTGPNYHGLIKSRAVPVFSMPKICGKAHDEIDHFLQLIANVRSDTIFRLAFGQSLLDYSSNRKELGRLFRTNGNWKSLSVHLVPGRINVAVHLRRGDVSTMAEKHLGNWKLRFVSEDWFTRIMDAIPQVGLRYPPSFHIYSQGQVSDFPELAERTDVVFHLDADEKETMLNMIKADILLMSPSGFSFLAGLLSEGLKIARIPWWHHLPDDDDWLLLEEPLTDDLELRIAAAMAKMGMTGGASVAEPNLTKGGEGRL